MHVWRRMACASAVMASAWCWLGAVGLTRPLRTVQEHFLGIPAPLLPLGPRENRLRYLRYGMVDEPNGYIRYQASDNPERFEFAIFRKSNGQYLAAFSVPYDPHFFDQPIPSQLILLDYRQGQWRDVTRELLPVPFDPTLTYRLPRVGRDIVVVNRRNQTLYRLRWHHDRLVRLGA
jgi:hypothetical protein